MDLNIPRHDVQDELAVLESGLPVLGQDASLGRFAHADLGLGSCNTSQ